MRLSSHRKKHLILIRDIRLLRVKGGWSAPGHPLITLKTLRKLTREGLVRGGIGAVPTLTQKAHAALASANKTQGGRP